MEGEGQEFEAEGLDSWYFSLFLSSFFEEKIFILFYLFSLQLYWGIIGK